MVQYKQQSRLEEKRKKALDLQLDFIVGQTEKYSDLLSKSLATTRPAETVPLSPQKSVPAAVEDDGKETFSEKTPAHCEIVLVLIPRFKWRCCHSYKPVA